MKKSIERWHLVEVVFGNPTKQCAGHGICKLLQPGVRNNHCLSCGKTLAYNHLSENNDQLVFTFIKKWMEPALISRLFNGGWFLQEEKLLCLSSSSHLPGERTFILLSGEYPIIETRNYYEIGICIETVFEDNPLSNIIMSNERVDLV